MVFHSSTIAMMHGPINIESILICYSLQIGNYKEPISHLITLKLHIKKLSSTSWLHCSRKLFRKSSKCNKIKIEKKKPALPLQMLSFKIQKCLYRFCLKQIRSQNKEQSIWRGLSCYNVCYNTSQHTKYVPSEAQPGSASTLNVTELLPLWRSEAAAGVVTGAWDGRKENLETLTGAPVNRRLQVWMQNSESLTEAPVNRRLRCWM